MKSELWFREKGRDIPYNHSITHFLPPLKNSVGRSFKLGEIYGCCKESTRAKIMLGPCWLTLIKSVQPSDYLTRSIVVLIDLIGCRIHYTVRRKWRWSGKTAQLITIIVRALHILLCCNLGNISVIVCVQCQYFCRNRCCNKCIL